MAGPTLADARRSPKLKGVEAARASIPKTDEWVVWELKDKVWIIVYEHQPAIGYLSDKLK
jgi:hypothetical protein